MENIVLSKKLIDTIKILSEELNNKSLEDFSIILKEKSEKLDTQTLVTHIIGELCVEKPKSILRFFIAGAKKLKLS